MNNEQTQAEKLAEKIVDEVASGVLNHLMGVQVGTPRHLSIQRASELIVKAITQATAELRAENERLKAAEFWTDWVYPEGAKPEYIQNELADYHFVMSQVAEVYAELTAGLMSKPNYYAKDIISQVRSVQEDDTQEAIKEAIREIQVERDQAQAQVAVLVNVLEPVCEALELARASESAPTESSHLYADNMTLPGFYELREAKQALKDTQATADAYTAKVRREAIEACLHQLNKLMPVFDPGKCRTEYESGLQDGFESLKYLLPKTDEKGGADGKV